MKAWMIALCLSCVLGAMIGVLLGGVCWHMLDAPAPVVQGGSITINVHTVQGTICGPKKTPCQVFEGFTRKGVTK